MSGRAKQVLTVAGLDLGPKQFVGGVAEVEASGRLILRALKEVPAQGFGKDGLTDPIECADGIGRLLRAIDRVTGIAIPSVSVCFPANHLKCFNASASIPIPEPGVGVSHQDVEKVIQTCLTLSVEYDQRVLHTFERSFTVDGQTGIKSPVGLTGRKLGVELHIVTASETMLQNLTRVIHRSGLEVDGFVAPGLACGQVVLSELDRDLGVALIRIGDHAVELLLYSDGQLKESFVLKGGTEDLIDHIGSALRLPRVAAESIFTQVHSVEERPESASVALKAGVGATTRSISEAQVVSLIRMRCRELVQRIRRTLAVNPLFRDCASGVVVVGSLVRLDGFLEMLEGALNVPVRMGVAKGVELEEGMKPRQQDIPLMGLIAYKMNEMKDTPASSVLPLWLKPLSRFRKILKDYF